MFRIDCLKNIDANRIWTDNAPSVAIVTISTCAGRKKDENDIDSDFCNRRDGVYIQRSPATVGEGVKQEPLEKEFATVWDANVEQLYES
ncbi:MAG: hypothetical protein OXF24_00690 [Hyphomicrobiales bacterium]|nr:hypothetical protein [Hyphomicrobiales bacterium]